MSRENRYMYVYSACLFCLLLVVTMWGSVGKVCCVVAIVKDIGFLSIGVLKYVCVKDTFKNPSLLFVYLHLIGRQVIRVMTTM